MADFAGVSVSHGLDIGVFNSNFVGLDIGAGGGEPPGPAPLIEWLDPAPGTPITRAAAITVRVTDSDLELAVLSARFATLGVEEVIWRDGEFAARYRSSTRDVLGLSWTFTIRRTGGWPASVRLAVDAVDADGQVGSE